VGHPKLPEFEKGTVFGCWVIVRPSAIDSHGRHRYLCRAICCGGERILRPDYLRGKKRACVHCKGNGQKAEARP
jgi:hypothetical protein